MNMDSGEKRIGVLGIASGNASPALEVHKGVLHKMTLPNINNNKIQGLGDKDSIVKKRT